MQYTTAASSSDEISLPFLRFLPSNENTFYTLSDDEDKLTIGWSIFHFPVIFYFSFFRVWAGGLHCGETFA